MTDHPLKGLCIRSGVVWQKDKGFLLACDPKTEEQSPHAKIVRWHRGVFSHTSAKFNAHSICRIRAPEEALVFACSEGFYGIYTQTRSIGGNIFSDSRPVPKQLRYGSIRSVSGIAGKAYAVGLRGMVYRLDGMGVWTRIDDGLPESFDVQAIDGFHEGDLYAVGFRGELWHFDGLKWAKRELPTNVNLTSVKCGGDRSVYLAGHDGMLIRRKTDQWETIDSEEMTKDIWDLEWFDGALFVSTYFGVYRLSGAELEPVDFGGDRAKSYHLSAAEDVMWSIGETDVMAFDGTDWTRIV